MHFVENLAYIGFASSIISVGEKFDRGNVFQGNVLLGNVRLRARSGSFKSSRSSMYTGLWPTRTPNAKA